MVHSTTLTSATLVGRVGHVARGARSQPFFFRCPHHRPRTIFFPLCKALSECLIHDFFSAFQNQEETPGALAFIRGFFSQLLLALLFSLLRVAQRLLLLLLLFFLGPFHHESLGRLLERLASRTTGLLSRTLSHRLVVLCTLGFFLPLTNLGFFLLVRLPLHLSLPAFFFHPLPLVRLSV